jgi:sugar transferase (PEP-CTERM/EpsH1 system associated)
MKIYMAKEHIVHLTPTFGCGGLERVIANLVSDPISQRMKHSVISLEDDISFQYALPDNVKIYTLKKRAGLDLHAHIRLAKLLRKLNPTVLHTYNFGTLEYHVIAKLCGVKIHVHADHGLGGDQPDGANKKHNLFRRAISTIIDHYIVVSDDLKIWVTQTVGVAEHKVEFVFNGVPVPAKHLKDKRARNVLRLIIVGRLAGVKNHLRLLDSIEILQRSSPELDIQCDIVGDGPMKDAVNKKIATLPDPSVIHMHGHQNDVASFLEKADALILSSDYEAMPMTVLEAMAASRPVICPMVGGVCDFISQREAVLVGKHDTKALAAGILALVHMTYEDETKMVEAAYEKVASTYSLSAMAKKYASFYKI